MKKRWLLVPFVLVAGAGFDAYTWWQSPSTTTVDYGSKSVHGVLGSDITLKDWQTAYFTTKYPSTLRIRTTKEDDTGTTSGNYMLSNVLPRQQDQVGVTVAALGNNSLNELPAVRLRSAHPQTYQLSGRSYAPAGSLVYTTLDDSEIDVFWQHNGVYAAVAVSGTASRQAELEQAMQAIISNWQWR